MNKSLKGAIIAIFGLITLTGIGYGLTNVDVLLNLPSFINAQIRTRTGGGLPLPREAALIAAEASQVLRDCYADLGWDGEEQTWIWLDSLEQSDKDTVENYCQEKRYAVLARADQLITREIATNYVELLIQYGTCLEAHGLTIPENPGVDALVDAVLSQPNWLRNDDLKAWNLNPVDRGWRFTRNPQRWDAPCIYPLIWDSFPGQRTFFR